MKQAIDNTDVEKSKLQIIAEYFLFCCCLCIIALRATISEGAKVQTSLFQFNISDNYHSLAVSAVLLVSVCIWTVIWLFGRFRYKFTLMEAGLFIFIFAAGLSFYAASNKRSAITDISLLICPILTAIMLVQILDRKKIYILLAVIASLGAVNAYKCINQSMTESKYLIEQYEKDPQSILKPLGIEPNSFNQMLFEHRIYSKDINGFFTTGNSAGSFAILSLFCAIGILCRNLKYKISYRMIALSIFIFAGLLITHSKGANAAAFIFLGCFGLYLWKTDLVRKHKLTIAALGSFLIMFICTGTVYYGIKYGTLPGGKSMMIRWEYWQAAAGMIKDHLWTGVGAGNFASYYFHYKLPQGIETISDPHNFILRILTEYGVIGCIGFLMIIMLPMLNYIFSHQAVVPSSEETNTVSKKSAVFISITIALVLVGIRPLLLSLPQMNSSAERIYLFAAVIVPPAAVFLISCWIIIRDLNENNPSNSTNSIITTAVFCGICAVLLHGMVDFAFYEAGVYTSFWAIFACMAAAKKSRNPPGSDNIVFKVFAAVLILAAGTGFFMYSLIPCKRTTELVQKATVNGADAENLLQKAAAIDIFEPKVCSLIASSLTQQYKSSQDKDANLLLNAQKYIEQAIERDPADFKNYESMTEMYLMMGKFKEAFDTAQQAVQKYPNSDRLRFTLAVLAEKNNDAETAIANYSAAVEIEDRYRRQYKILYPQRKFFSRLGEDKYQTAKERLSLLQKAEK